MPSQIIKTSGHNHNCLVNSIAINLIVRSQFGIDNNDITPVAIKYNPRFKVLFDELKKQPKDLAKLGGVVDEKERVDAKKVGSFEALYQLPLDEAQNRVGTALRKIASEQLLKEQNLHKDVFFQYLSADFKSFKASKKKKSNPSDLFQGMDFINKKFTELKIDVDGENKLKKWWVEEGYKLYTQELAKPGVFLGVESAAAISRALGMDFHFLDARYGGINQATVDGHPICITAHYNGSNHWSAYLDERLIQNYNTDKDKPANNQLTLARDLKTAKPMDKRSNNGIAKKAKAKEYFSEKYGLEFDTNLLDRRHTEALSGYEVEASNREDHIEAYILYFYLAKQVNIKTPTKQQASAFAKSYVNHLNSGKKEYEALGLCIASMFQSPSAWSHKEKVEAQLFFAKELNAALQSKKLHEIDLFKFCQSFYPKVEERIKLSKLRPLWIRSAEKFDSISAEVFREQRDGQLLFDEQKGTSTILLNDNTAIACNVNPEKKTVTLSTSGCSLKEGFRKIALLYKKEYEGKRLPLEISLQSITPPEQAKLCMEEFKAVGFKQITLAAGASSESLKTKPESKEEEDEVVGFSM